MANLPSMTPYLIRAFYEWSVDNDFTPQLSVLAEPEDYRCHCAVQLCDEQ